MENVINFQQFSQPFNNFFIKRWLVCQSLGTRLIELPFSMARVLKKFSYKTLDKAVYTYYILWYILNLGGAMAGEHGRCPNCGSDRVVKAGKYRRGPNSVEQRYLCNACRKFTTKPIQQLELIKSQELPR